MSDNKVYQDDLSIDPDDGRIRLNQLKEEDAPLLGRSFGVSTTDSLDPVGSSHPRWSCFGSTR